MPQVNLYLARTPHVSDAKAADFTIFSNRAPFQAYFDATDKYLADFGVEFKTNDFWDDLLDKRRKQLAVLKMLDRVCGDDNEQRGKIVGRQACHITVQNPFTGRDLLRRAEFDAFRTWSYFIYFNVELTMYFQCASVLRSFSTRRI
jgi:hypothetical protein